ncbi:MAG: hypothetical protein LBL80_01580 [Ruminococcus sp.]|jgi:hypothetical protein|nr:hypothetical protein [Ruminococcus sp.]
MESEFVIRNQYLLMYNSGIKDLKLFERDFPNSIEEYNYWQGVLEQMRNTMMSLGMGDLEPLPPKK